MIIKFLKVCEAPQEYLPVNGWRTEWEPAWFEAGEEVDPHEPGRLIDLADLKYKEDYEIVEYP